MNGTSKGPAFSKKSPVQRKRLLGWPGIFFRRGLMLVFLSVVCTGPLYALSYHVSPLGDDNNPGTESRPFRTIEKARRAVRETNRTMSGDISVYLHGGVYVLPATLRFDADDSGFNGFKVIYRAFPGERPVLSGGRPITGWRSVGEGIYKAQVGAMRFRQLYVNGRRAVRARTPNEGNYYRIREWNSEERKIGIAGDQIGNWERLHEVEFVHQKIMCINFMRIDSFSSSWSGILKEQVKKVLNRTGVFSYPSAAGMAYVVPAEPERTRTFQDQVFPYGAAGQAFHFENAYEFLDVEGEWYLNTQTGELFYKARRGEEMSTAVVIAPVLETLATITGTLDAPVRNLQFHGLTFEHTNWLLPSDEGYISDGGSGLALTKRLPTGQAEAQMTSYPGIRPPAGIHLEAAVNTRFERNIFRHMGAGGVVLYSGTRDTVLEGNVFTGISGNGLAVDMNLEGNPEDKRKISQREVIRNNYFCRVSLDAGVAIHAGYPEAITIEHNEVTDVPYIGILVGWGWSLENNAMKNNIIRYNRVWNVMNLLADGGGIYTLSKQPGTIIAENFIFDIEHSPTAPLNMPIGGIYLDQGSDFIAVHDNVFKNVPVKIHLNNEGSPPVGSNNVFFNNDKMHSSVIDGSGLQPEYKDILNSVR
ncbi:MAG: right-handed parallel beta-helix repeat-containing protein [Desulfuromonadaceae bacterium]|nr:right-handed parallel beta-helix repeat-containing protein [Desulfuromonadaceae bacterium]